MNKYPLMKGPNYFQRNYSFAGCMTAGEFWSDLGVRLITLLCASILLCIVVAVSVSGDAEKLAVTTEIAAGILAVIWLSPVIPMTRRRLRDGGFTAKAYLWLLLPGIGTVVFLARLCAKTEIEDMPRPNRRY